MPVDRYETERLILRQWQESDVQPFIALNQDPQVLRFFPRLYTPQETKYQVEEFKQHFIEYGYTIYACELKSSKRFIGFVGLFHRFDMPFSPCVEIGWRLEEEYWGLGLAPEAAAKCLEIAFNEFNLNEIVAFTSKLNKPSERVMQKIGMKYNSRDDFYHYKLNNDHPLCLHVLYRITKTDFLGH